MASNREILHISLGTSACHTSSHYLNLNGLSVTTTIDKDSGDLDVRNDSSRTCTLCDPFITHSADTTLGSILVPRSLFIDVLEEREEENDEEERGAVENLNDDFLNVIDQMRVSDLSSLKELETTLESSKYLWSGSLEALDLRKRKQQQPLTDQKSQAQRMNDPSQLTIAREVAQQLAFSTHSRYRVVPTQMRRFPSKHVLDHSSLNSNSNDARIVDWDSLPEEEDEEVEEDEEDRRIRLQKHQNHWEKHVYPQLQSQMDSFWTDSRNSGEIVPPTELEGRAEKKLPAHLSWRDYLMPPFHPQSIVNLLTPGNRNDWDHYFPFSQNRGAAIDPEWIENVFLDRIRLLLEDCDSCQGVTVASSGNGAFAGLSTQLLCYLKDDCPSARRWIWCIEEDAHRTRSNEKSWRSQRVEHIRRDIQVGIMWQDCLESAHSILTLRSPTTISALNRRQQQQQNIAPHFPSEAIFGAALETSTLPFRISSSVPSSACKTLVLDSSCYGGFGGGDDTPFSTVGRVTLSEFLNTLQPSPALSVLQLDALLPGTLDQKIHSMLMEGTTFDRRISHSTKNFADPGKWMMDPSHGGILFPLSPCCDNVDRSQHTHFGLSSALRWEVPVPSKHEDYALCLLQGMGIRYRPESSLALHARQSLASLTKNGYGAGSYWKHETAAWPVLSVIGNTTRFFPHAQGLAQGLRDSLSPRHRGFLNRDVANEILPEPDDCSQAFATLCDMRDKYQPPSGSGLMNEDGDAGFLD